MTASLAVYFLGAGLCGGILDGVLAPVRRRGLLCAIPCDILLAASLAGLHLLAMILWCDGQVFGYAVLAQALGFFLGRAVIYKLSSAFSRRKRHSATRVHKYEKI